MIKSPVIEGIEFIIKKLNETLELKIELSFKEEIRAMIHFYERELKNHDLTFLKPSVNNSQRGRSESSLKKTIKSILRELLGDEYTSHEFACSHPLDSECDDFLKKESDVLDRINVLQLHYKGHYNTPIYISAYDLIRTEIKQKLITYLKSNQYATR